jgi:acyl carrier protein
MSRLVEKDKIVEIISQILEESNYEIAESWDSLTHLQILTALDSELGGGVSEVEGLDVAFTLEEVLHGLQRANLLV